MPPLGWNLRELRQASPATGLPPTPLQKSDKSDELGFFPCDWRYEAQEKGPAQGRGGS